MMWLTVYIGMIFSGTPLIQVPYPDLISYSHLRTDPNHFRQHESVRHKLGCIVLRSGKTMKRVVSAVRPACFLIEVGPEEAEQVAVTQPEDLELHVSGKVLERLVDGFDMGNETVTLQGAGSYRIEVGEVKPAPGALTISVSMKKLRLSLANPWEEAEKWATRSKRSKAMDTINQSLALWNELGDKSSVARTYLKREAALRDTDIPAAVADDERALELCRTISDTRCAAEAANNSGFFSLELGEFDAARQRLEEAAQDWGRLPDAISEGRTRSNLGLLFWESGDFEQAINFDHQAEVVLRAKETLGYAKVLNNLGLCYQSLAEYEKSRRYFESAIAGFSRSHSPKDLVRARLNLGRTYMLQNRLAQAQSLLEQVLAEARKLSDSRVVADGLRNLGQTLWHRGDLEQAEANFSEALKLDQSNGNRRGQSSALHSLGLVARQHNDLAAARSFLTQAVQIRRESGLRDDAAESLSALADLEYGQGKLEAARDYAEQALKLLESVRSLVPSPSLRASFYTRKQQFFDLLVNIAMAPATPGSSGDGFLAAERGRARALMDLLAGGSLLQLPPDLEKRRAGIQRHIDFLADRLSSVPPDQQDRLLRQVQQLVDENEEVETQIRQTIAEKKLGRPLDSIQEIQRNCLPANSALLEFHLGAHKSYLWLVDAQQVRSFELLPASIIENEASTIIRLFGQILERRRSHSKQASFQRALSKLSGTLLGGLAGVTLPPRLILVPDGVLHRIPFAALRLPHVSVPIGLTHDLIQSPSAAYLLTGRPPQPIAQFPQTVLAMVDPVFSGDDPRVPQNRRTSLSLDSGLTRLPFTREVGVIESLVSSSRRKTLRGFDASREMLDRLPVGDFAVLHFSTHALIDDAIPELSRIVLSRVDRAGRPVNGLLLPYALAQLHLNGSIVVVSACDTALGKQVLGEGLAGFTSSLFLAGGSQLVLTITEVDAEGSSDFFSDVYRRFLAGSATMEHAMTLARRAMARMPQYSDPYYWASFIVIGRPSDRVSVAANKRP